MCTIFFEKIACAETAEPRMTVSYTTGLLFSKTWMHFDLRVSVSSLLTIPLKSTVKLIDTHAMLFENQLLCCLKTSEHLLEDRLTVGGMGCLCCIVACAGLTTDGTMIL